MPGLLLFILIGVPLVEIFLFIEIGGAIGAGWTVLLIFATAMIGLSMMRRQGLDVLRRAQTAQARGGAPLGEIAHGVLILLAGLMLLTPGFLTDALGFFLLWPAGRLFLMASLLEALLPNIIGRFGAGPVSPQKPSPEQNIIEGDYKVNDQPSGKE
jgi:UPF0716 protein FxsA